MIFHGGQEMNFKFSPDILSRLGEELISNPEQGIIELVKNSYDADATNCTLELKGTSTEGGSITISDDGLGMDEATIINGWLVIGRSKKISRQLTDLGRLPVGDKGLGRLAALRQGSQVTLLTRPANEPEIEYSLTIDWSEFDKVDVVEAVNFNIDKHETNKSHGTDIIINNLHIKLARREIQKLARELILLADPFGDSTGFHPRLIAPEFSDLEQQVHNAYFDDAEFHLRAELNEYGIANAWFSDWKGNVLFRADQHQFSERPYRTAPATLDLWVFILNTQSFSTRKSSISEVQKWLSVVGGVRLYHRGLRVRPYGDQGYDWLDMNLARARSPEMRPSTNTSVGMVVVDDPEDILIQKTDRIGFVENEAFFELKRFAVDAMNWMAKERLKEAEKRREKVRENVSRKTTEAKVNIDKVVDVTVPVEARPIVKKALQQYEQAREREAKALREDLQLYRGMATAGVTVAVFAHESGKPVTQIVRITKHIETVGKRLLGSEYIASLEGPVSSLRRSAETIKNFAMLPLHLLKREKRRSEVVNVHTVIDELVEVFKPFLNDAQIQLVCEKVDRKVNILGSISLLEVILTNFLTNSINAFTKVEGAPIQNRKIVIRTEVTKTELFREHLLLRVLDNALGIIDIDLKEIWIPGRSTITDGTGFGLTIVKDSVSDLGGSVQAIAQGELGGAEFIVELPLVEGK